MPESGMSGMILSLLMLAGIALGAGGVYLIAKRPDSRKQGWLMIVAGMVMFANVAIWVAPL